MYCVAPCRREIWESWLCLPCSPRALSASAVLKRLSRCPNSAGYQNLSHGPRYFPRCVFMDPQLDNGRTPSPAAPQNHPRRDRRTKSLSIASSAGGHVEPPIGVVSLMGVTEMLGVQVRPYPLPARLNCLTCSLVCFFQHRPTSSAPCYHVMAQQSTLSEAIDTTAWRRPGCARFPATSTRGGSIKSGTFASVIPSRMWFLYAETGYIVDRRSALETVFCCP